MFAKSLHIPDLNVCSMVVLNPERLSRQLLQITITVRMAANYVHRMCRDQWVVNGGMLGGAKYKQAPTSTIPVHWALQCQ